VAPFYEETMTAARLKRLTRLEARVPKGRPYVDPFPLAMALWEAFKAEHAATKAGRAFSRVPRTKAELGETVQDAFDRAMAEHDSIARRLAAAVAPFQTIVQDESPRHRQHARVESIGLPD
jgi:hypothetical protein